ncbi:MAG: DUF2007 domain-containing protein [Chitinophagaceae bacterium]
MLDADINCYLKDEFTVTIDPILSNAIGGIKLCVADTDFLKAKELLLVFEEEQKITCPKCGSKSVQYINQPKNPANWLFAIASWFLTSYALKGKEIYHCFDCKYEFEDIEESPKNTEK